MEIKTYEEVPLAIKVKSVDAFYMGVYFAAGAIVANTVFSLITVLLTKVLF